MEAELGVRLLHRSTSRLVLTEAGQELFRRARLIVAEAEAAWNAVRRLDEVPRGLLRVSVPNGILDPLLLEYAADFPELRLEVLQTQRQVDLIGEGIDVAVRVGPIGDPNLIVRRVATARRVVVASTAYLERHGTPRSPTDLSEHACLVGFAGDETPIRSWPVVGGGTVEVSGPISAGSRVLLRQAAVAGLGLAFVPWLVVREQLKSGALVHVLADTVTATVPVSIVFADRQYIDPKVRVFVDRAAPELERMLAEIDPHSARSSA